MNIISSDFKRSISLGGSDTWKTLCATIKYYFSSQKSEYEHVFLFIEDNYLSSKECLTAAKEFNFLRDALSQIAPSKIIYDDKKPDQLPPWVRTSVPLSPPVLITLPPGRAMIYWLKSLRFLCMRHIPKRTSRLSDV